MKPASGAITDDREVVGCSICETKTGYKAAARWLKGFWRSFDVEQHQIKRVKAEIPVIIY